MKKCTGMKGIWRAEVDLQEIRVITDELDREKI